MIKKILNNEFVKNVITLLSGSVIGQIFVFLIMPVLTRLYSEELFGIYFIFLSTLNILKKVSTFRFELAIVLPKKNFWAINAFFTTVIITFSTTIIFFLLAYIFKKFFIHISKLNKIAEFLYLLPLTLFFTGIFEAFASWNNRKKKYPKISIGKISYSFGTGLSQIGFNFTFLKNTGLILGLIVGQIISTLTIFCITVKDILKNLKYVKLKYMKIIFFKYKKIPIFNTLINVFTNFSNEIPIYLITAFFSPAIAGLYGMANKITATPLDLLGRSIGQVFYQKASEKFAKKENLKIILKKTYKNLLKLSIIPAIVIIAVSPFIDFILGKKWNELTIYMLILLPSVIINFFVQPTSSIFTIVGKQNIMLIFLIISTLIKIFSIAAGFWFFESAVVSILFLSLANSIFRLFLIYWFYKIA